MMETNDDNTVQKERTNNVTMDQKEEINDVTVDQREDTHDELQTQETYDQVEIAYSVIPDQDTSVNEELLQTPDDSQKIYYNVEKLVHAARTSDKYSLSYDMLSLYYDCIKRGNLLMVDEKTLCFSAGNFVHFLNLDTNILTYLRTVDGYGIGHLTFHPQLTHLVVAETGDPPKIFIYEYPSLKLWRILLEGAKHSYAFVSFNSSGTLLASVATEPDYTLTIWNWCQENIILRTKAFFNDVHLVVFSPFTAGYLTTGGIGHIRFWKMAKTFTGLKLQGALGRFGKTEVSNIEGLIQLPDGKVLTGCEWGNILLWDGGLIKVEITRRMGKTCHLSAITQFIMEEGEILSIGSDGHIKVWQLEILDSADTTDDSDTFETEPLNETSVSPNAHLLYIVKSLNKNLPHIWYAQDRTGGIWSLDLSFSYTSKQPEKVISCHFGPITGMDVSPISHLVATAGNDGTVRLYDLLEKKLLWEYNLYVACSSLIWLPKELIAKCNLIAVGSDDGTLRIFSIESSVSVLNEPVVQLVVKNSKKPHKSRITSIACNPENKLIMTGGIDKTIFFMVWGNDRLNPLGFLTIPQSVTSVSFSSLKNSNLILITCLNGDIIFLNSPDASKKALSAAAKKKSFLMDSECLLSHLKFTSVKSKLKVQKNIKEYYEERSNKADASRMKKDDEYKKLHKKHKKEVSEIPEIQQTQPEEPLEESFYIPETPSPILFGFFASKAQKIWLSMGNFDAGYLYEYEVHSVMPEEEWEAIGEKFSINPDPDSVFLLENSDDVPVNSLSFSPNGHYVGIGFENGFLRIVKLSSSGLLNSSDYFWEQRMHDSDSGAVTSVKFSFDQRFLISAGSDGSLFCFTFNPEDLSSKSVSQKSAEIPEPSMTKEEILNVIDITDLEYPSLEEEKQHLEYNKFMKLIEKKRHSLHQLIRHLHNQFVKIQEQNNQLPTQLQLTEQELIISSNLRKEILKEFNSKKSQTIAELAWETEKFKLALKKLFLRFKEAVQAEILYVKAFNCPDIIQSYRLAYLTAEIQQLLATEDEDVKLKHHKSLMTSQTVVGEEVTLPEEKIQGTRSVRTSVAPIKLERRVFHILQRVEEKNRQKIMRKMQWDILMAQKPSENPSNPYIMKAIEETKNDIGDFCLKSASDYVVPEHLRMTTKRKLRELVQCIYTAYSFKNEFNQKVCFLRNKKIEIIQRMQWIYNRLTKIQKTMSLNEKMIIPQVPDMEPFEMPEKEFFDSRSLMSSFCKAGLMENIISTSKNIQNVDIGVDTSPSEPGVLLKPNATPLEVRLYKMNLLRNVYEQNLLLEEVSSLFKTFDNQILHLHHEKCCLDVSLKEGEIRQLILFAELKMLRQFEAQEEDLLTKLNNKIEEKSEMQNKIKDLQTKIETKKKEIEHLHEQEKVTQQQLQVMLGEHNKFGVFLTKVFKKRVKRIKKKTEEKEDDDEESTESDDDFDINFDEDEEDEFINDSVCPEGCEITLFNAVLQLRERRLDNEDILVDEKRQIELLKKEVDSIFKKLKNVDTMLRQVQAEFKKMQQEKQSRLNELLAVIPLKLNQIQYLEKNKLPHDLSHCLVFPVKGLKELEERIGALQHDKIIQRQNRRQNHEHFVHLMKECKSMDIKINKLEAKCEELMKEKLGCTVDMNSLESLAYNRALEEMKERLKELQEQHQAEKTQWKHQVENIQTSLLNHMLENSEKILKINKAVKEKSDMEHNMKIRRKNLPKNLLPEMLPGEVYEMKLEALITDQASENETLRKHLNWLRGKNESSDFPKA